MSALNIPPSDHERSGYDLPASHPSLSANIAKLESDLASEKELRCEERFIWIAVCYVLLMALLYTAMQSWFPFLLLFLLGLIVLVGIAERLGVDWAVRGVGGLMHWISEKANLGGKS